MKVSAFIERGRWAFTPTVSRRLRREKMVKAIFFDFYKTLCVWQGSLEATLQKVAERYRVDIDWKCYASARESLYAEGSASAPANHNFRASLEKIFDSYCELLKRVGVKAHVEQMTWELLQYEHSLFSASKATLYEDVIPTLRQLQGTGVKMAIVSNWDTPLHNLSERLNIAGYFDAIVASHDERVLSIKPEPAIFNYALGAVGVLAEETVHVGDTYEADIVGAQGVGIRAILIDRAGEQPGRWEETIQRLSELPGLLKSG